MKHTVVLTVIIILAITFISVGISLFLPNETEEHIEESLLFIKSNITLPREITFFADEMIFTDGNITITWNESGVLSLENFDNMIWNIGNKTFTYALVLGDER